TEVVDSKTIEVSTPEVGGLDYITTELAVSNLVNESWSNILEITFEKIVAVFIDSTQIDGIAGSGEYPGGLTFDTEGNCYVQGSDGTIYQINSSGQVSQFSTGVPVPFVGGELHIGPDNQYLYVATAWTDWAWDVWDGASGGLYRISLNDGTVEEYISGTDIWHPYSFDWDADGNMYVASYYVWNNYYYWDENVVINGALINKVTPNKTIQPLKEYALNAPIGYGGLLRIYNNEFYVYNWADNESYDDSHGIRKSGITDSGISADLEVMYEPSDWSPDNLHAATFLALDGAGNAYLMNRGYNSAVEKVTPDRTITTLATLPSEPVAGAFHGDFLYVATTNGGIYTLFIGETAQGGVPPKL
ncbi:MAG TPA: hypothetical protein VKA68_14570, partial [bacterium]|nr:hypothetical protein [bacterium]